MEGTAYFVLPKTVHTRRRHCTIEEYINQAHFICIRASLSRWFGQHIKDSSNYYAKVKMLYATEPIGIDDTATRNFILNNWRSETWAMCTHRTYISNIDNGIQIDFIGIYERTGTRIRLAYEELRDISSIAFTLIHTMLQLNARQRTSSWSHLNCSLRCLQKLLFRSLCICNDIWKMC